MTSVNTFFRSILDDLVEKRLWPVAAALVLALLAIPVLLSNPADKQPAPGPAAATPAVASGGPFSAFQPVVSTEGKKSSEIRKELEGFETKDPFKPQNLGGGGSSSSGSVEVQGGDTASSGGGGSVDVADSPPLGTSGAGGGGGSTPGSGAPTESQTFYYAYTADVRFGKEGNLDRKTLSQFRALPSSQDPVMVFMGVREDGETAIFLLSSAASSTGEGNCEPDDTCTFLYMKKGDKQRIEAVTSNNEVVTYALVLLDIDVKRTDGPETAESSSRKARSDRKARSNRKARTSRKARSKRNVERAKGRARGFQAIGF
ncbi:MAG: hypothetical protein ACRDLQ_01000 [Solirubrobacterales bacterium]